YAHWEQSLTARQPQQQTTHPRDDFAPAYSRRGDQIAFVSTRNSLPGVWIRDADGRERPVAHLPGDLAAPSWSPDGTRLTVNQVEGGERRLLVLDLSEASAPAAPRALSTGEDVVPFRAA